MNNINQENTDKQEAASIEQTMAELLVTLSIFKSQKNQKYLKIDDFSHELNRAIQDCRSKGKGRNTTYGTLTLT